MTPRTFPETVTERSGNKISSQSKDFLLELLVQGENHFHSVKYVLHKSDLICQVLQSCWNILSLIYFIYNVNVLTLFTVLFFYDSYIFT